jgi:predicted lipid-binding transport protein (Tim44 family)
VSRSPSEREEAPEESSALFVPEPRSVRSIRALVLMLALGLAAWPTSAAACAACFGRADGPMAQGLNMGILSLLLVVLSVLLGIAAFFVFLMVRSARASAPTATAQPAAPAASTANETQKLSPSTQS